MRQDARGVALRPEGIQERRQEAAPVAHMRPSLLVAGASCRWEAKMLRQGVDHREGPLDVAAGQAAAEMAARVVRCSSSPGQQGASRLRFRVFRHSYCPF